MKGKYPQMPAMSWQMIIAPFGVVAIVSLTWLLGGLKRPAKLDPEGATRRLLQDFPLLRIAQWTIASEGDSALARDDQGRVAAIARFGDRLTTRLWAKGEISNVQTNDNTLIVSTHDYKVPDMRFAFDDREQLSAWRTTLIGLIGRPA